MAAVEYKIGDVVSNNTIRQPDPAALPFPFPSTDPYSTVRYSNMIRTNRQQLDATGFGREKQFRLIHHGALFAFTIHRLGTYTISNIRNIIKSEINSDVIPTTIIIIISVIINIIINRDFR